MSRHRLSVEPLAAAYLAERFDTHPHPLLRVGRPVGEATEEARRRFTEAGRQQLARRGLLDRDDLDPFLEDAWYLLSRPPLAVGLAVRAEGGTSFNAVAVEQGRATIRAYQADGANHDDLQNIVLSRHDFGGPAGNAVELLGRFQPGTGRAASVPTQVLDEVGRRMRGDASGSLLTALSSSGVRGPEARSLAAALTAKRELDGVFTVRRHDRRVGRTHRAPYSLMFFTTAEGAFAARRSEGGDGRDWFTVIPVDQRKLTAEIEAMIRATAPAPR